MGYCCHWHQHFTLTVTDQRLCWTDPVLYREGRIGKWILTAVIQTIAKIISQIDVLWKAYHMLLYVWQPHRHVNVLVLLVLGSCNWIISMKCLESVINTVYLIVAWSPRAPFFSIHRNEHNTHESTSKNNFMPLKSNPDCHFHGNVAPRARSCEASGDTERCKPVKMRAVSVVSNVHHEQHAFV